MKQEYITQKANEYIKEYAMRYQLEISNVIDRWELFNALENLEAQECVEFMQRNHINFAQYPMFRKVVLQELRKLLKKERKSKAKDRNEIIDLISDIYFPTSYNDYYFNKLMITLQDDYSSLNMTEKEKISKVILTKLKRDMQTENIPRNDLKTWILSKLKLYKVPSKLATDIYQKYIIEKMIQDSQRIEEIYQKILNIGEEVYVKKPKTGTICGYIIKNELETKHITNKNDLKRFLNQGYQLESYQIKTKKWWKESIQEQKKEEIKRPIKTPKKKWKKYAFFAGCIAILIGIQSCHNQKKSTSSNYEVESTIDLHHFVSIPKIDLPEKENKIIEIDKENQRKEKISLEKKERIPDEFEILLDSMPASYAKYQLTEDAKIYQNLSNDNIKGSKLYFTPEQERQNKGYVLLDSSGNQYIYEDPVKVVELLQYENFTYVGSRAINDYSFDSSGNIVDYEGLFANENIKLLEQEDTLLDEIKKKDKSRILTRD